MSSRLVGLIATASVLGIVAGRPAAATPIFYTGDVIFAPTGTQFGRLERNGIASDWGSVKPFPNTFSALAPDAYELFTVNAGIAPFLQITFRDRSGLLYPAAYRDSFNPVNFRIEVAPFSTIVLPINELSPGAGTGAQFSLLVEGFLDANFTPLPPGSDMLPEPASVVLVATGVLASIRRRRSKRSSTCRQAVQPSRM